MAITYSKIILFTTVLALSVMMLGAYTRLSNAGLGCPDWPGCYGHLSVPNSAVEIQKAQSHFPDQLVETPKAWKEMIHRYFAGILALLVMVIVFWSVIRRRDYPQQPLLVPFILFILIIGQAMLGMWTVTWKVLPIIVTAHLLGGMALVGLLTYLYLMTKPSVYRQPIQAIYLKPWVKLGFFILLMQLFLGAWTSTTYSALVCHDFPFCHGQLFPHLALRQAFELFQPVGINYEGGVLETPVRMTIQMMHRYGALLTTVYWGILALWIIFANGTEGLRAIGGCLLVVLIIQVLLGITNIMLSLPIGIAVAHNGVAALLLLTVVVLLNRFSLQSADWGS